MRPVKNTTSFSRAAKTVLALSLCGATLLAEDAQAPFPVTSVVDAPSIAGRAVALDAQGKLLPWPMPDNTGYSYSAYFLSQWTILWDQYNRQRLPYFYCCFDFDRTTFELVPDEHWVNSTGYLRAMMQGFIERLYPYTGDPRTLEFLQSLVDYELENGRTPEGYAWARVPYPSANPGAKRYTGWSNHGEDFIEPHVVGEDGYAYLRLYETTGDTKYLEAAIRCAEALVQNFRAGDEKNSPWPNRCFARDASLGNNKAMFPYSANVIEPIMLFDELIRIGQGDVAAYRKVREGAWQWFVKYPLQNNVWVGYFEDVQGSYDNMNQVIPLEFARYVLLHPDKDPQWREHSARLIQWVKSTPKWPKYIVHGATVTTEQGNGKEFCCNLPNQCCDSHSARLAAIEALYFAKTGDPAYKEAAYRTYNWVTYFQGLPGKAHAPYTGQWWWTDEFSDGPRRMMDAFWAVPEWAPSDESHLLGSLSPITKIAYGTGSVTYSTFDSESTDVLRLDFVPGSVMAGGKPLQRRQDPAAEGFTFDETNRVLRIHHSSSRDISIQGKDHGGDGQAHPLYVTFDDPHLAAGTVLNGQYPSGVIDWPDAQWQIGVPAGKFGTFNLVLKNPGPLSSLTENGRRKTDTQSAEFRFAAPRIFAGFDVCNDGNSEATVTVRADNVPGASYAIKPGELLRIRTGWRDATSRVSFAFANAQGLRFDNLAYQRPQ
jgi:hypothetical protein